MSRRLFQAAEISSEPRLQEPVFLCEIQVSSEAKGNVYSLLNKKRAQIVEETQIQNTPLYTVKAYLPVAESFQFTEKLREASGGKALN